MDLIKQKNSNLSIILIVVNILLVFIFLNSGTSNEHLVELNLCVLVWTTTILVGLYAFVYRGEGNGIAKWIFVALLLLSIVLIGLFLYIVGLSSAFQH